MTPSANLVAFVKGWEACSLTSYRDAAGLWTIGWGHLLDPNEPVDPITQDEADALFETELHDFGEQVDVLCPLGLTQWEYDALVAFAFNVGLEALRKSTLIRRVRDLDMDGAAFEFSRWNKAGGRIVEGLVKRRAAERNVFQRGDYSGRP